MKYQVHDENTAPQAAQDVLRATKEKYGFTPNLFGLMAEAPVLLKAYIVLSGLFEESSFSPMERQIALLTASFANGCDYCMAAHSTIAEMQKIPPETILALRRNTPLADGKLEALHRLAYEVVEWRGNPSEEAVKKFLDEGYTQKQVLELILGVGLKTLSNYTNHIAQTPLDEAFEKNKWKNPLERRNAEQA
ncbi:MAG: carboxymuconolactone decarboxylase family protein [Alphaproteobacteria bacterium]|nr:carboxymuconolactone decarboxylase family protein [Alphaproteobacteria bacterium]